MSGTTERVTLRAPKAASSTTVVLSISAMPNSLPMSPGSFPTLRMSEKLRTQTMIRVPLGLQPATTALPKPCPLISRLSRGSRAVIRSVSIVTRSPGSSSGCGMIDVNSQGNNTPAPKLRTNGKPTARAVFLSVMYLADSSSITLARRLIVGTPKLVRASPSRLMTSLVKSFRSSSKPYGTRKLIVRAAILRGVRPRIMSSALNSTTDSFGPSISTKTMRPFRVMNAPPIMKPTRSSSFLASTTFWIFLLSAAANAVPSSGSVSRLTGGWPLNRAATFASVKIVS